MQPATTVQNALAYFLAPKEEFSMAFDLNCLTCGQILELEDLIG